MENEDTYLFRPNRVSQWFILGLSKDWDKFIPPPAASGDVDLIVGEGDKCHNAVVQLSEID